MLGMFRAIPFYIQLPQVVNTWKMSTPGPCGKLSLKHGALYPLHRPGGVGD